MNRLECLHAASQAIHGPREADYGSPTDNFQRIAKGWEVIFGVDISPAQVALAMGWVKTCRLIHNPKSEDGWLDKAGYAACGAEVATSTPEDL